MQYFEGSVIQCVMYLLWICMFFKFCLRRKSGLQRKVIVLKQNALMRMMKKESILTLMILLLMMMGDLLQIEGRKESQSLQMRK